MTSGNRGAFEDVIRKAILIGEDSDTIAAMAGSIAEAYYGIPKDIAEEAFDVLQETVGTFERYNNSVLLDEVVRFWNYLETRGMKYPKLIYR